MGTKRPTIDRKTFEKMFENELSHKQFNQAAKVFTRYSPHLSDSAVYVLEWAVETGSNELIEQVILKLENHWTSHLAKLNPKCRTRDPGNAVTGPNLNERFF